MKLTPVAIDARRARAAEMQRQIAAHEELINRLGHQVATEKKRLRDAHATYGAIVSEIISGETDDEQLALDEVAADDGPALSAQDRADLDAAAAEGVAHNRREDVRRHVLLALEGGARADLMGLVHVLGPAFKAMKATPATQDEVAPVVEILVRTGVVEAEERKGLLWYRLRPAPKKPARSRKGCAS